jgi:hypothetical protein
MVAVDPAFSGRNVCYDLFLVSSTQGYLHGMTLATAKCMNPRASHFYKIGGTTLKPCLYKDMRVGESRPFEGITDPDGVRFAFISLG